jgi:hypothetical protein
MIGQLNEEFRSLYGHEASVNIMQLKHMGSEYANEEEWSDIR